MIRIAIAGPDGAGKTTLCKRLLNCIDKSELQYAGKNRGHLLRGTSLGLKAWMLLKQHGSILSIIGQYFVFYPLEYFENMARFQKVSCTGSKWIIYDRHPIDRMVLKYDILIRRNERKVKFNRFFVEYPLRLFWECVYKCAFPGVNRVYVLLPYPELCFKRSGGQYQNLDEARIRIETYRRTAAQDNNMFMAINIDHNHTVEDICKIVLADIDDTVQKRFKSTQTFNPPKS
ncbi:MAG: hypothetical protein HQK65_12825 [Desulfamplus sp.]|nr:hypothetical protein [Desulfamplus sp.]